LPRLQYTHFWLLSDMEAKGEGGKKEKYQRGGLTIIPSSGKKGGKEKRVPLTRLEKTRIRRERRVALTET